eukprot:gnl/Dysnectes_brevis/5399_a7748_602.p1 GENE.gnl/Dysnectes_brevis/5399_a7748_602~~gnl/Dysnectes_brevis/5399_a7748_602.p1  ORF type:complete len:283 (+),score=41.22 gnl/Dysnectes_brevis/5399_a7748_602:106-954(+)
MGSIVTRCAFPYVPPSYVREEISNIEIIHPYKVREECIAISTIEPHIRDAEHQMPTLLYTHGNGEDLGHIESWLRFLSRQFHCRVVSFDYRGYGLSRGTSSEKNLLQDADAVYQHLLQRHSLAPSDLIIFGRSIGTVAAVHLARHPVRGCILQSPIATAGLVGCGRRMFFVDCLNSMRRAHSINLPCLIIHGTLDEIVPVTNGIRLFDALPMKDSSTLELIPNAGHNDIEAHHLEQLMHAVTLYMAQRIQGEEEPSEEHGFTYGRGSSLSDIVIADGCEPAY